MKRDYLVGDECWVRIKQNGPLEAGIVVHWFIPHTQGTKFFVIQMDAVDLPELLVRDATLISPTADGPLPLEGLVMSDAHNAPPGTP